MGKRVKTEGVEQSDAARLLGLAKRPGLPASIDDHDGLPTYKTLQDLKLIYQYIEYAIDCVYALLNGVHDISITPPGRRCDCSRSERERRLIKYSSSN